MRESRDLELGNCLDAGHFDSLHSFSFDSLNLAAMCRKGNDTHKVQPHTMPHVYIATTHCDSMVGSIWIPLDNLDENGNQAYPTGFIYSETCLMNTLVH